MMSANNILSPANGTPIAIPSQDIVLGCYYLTKSKPGAKGEGRVFGNADFRSSTFPFERDTPTADPAQRQQIFDQDRHVSDGPRQHQIILFTVGRVLACFFSSRVDDLHIAQVQIPCHMFQKGCLFAGCFQQG